MYPFLSQLTSRYPELEVCTPSLEKALELLETCYRQGGKLLICGNGGSCADAQHIVGELMKGFLKKRPLSPEEKQAMRTAFPALPDGLTDLLQGALPAISLCEESALVTAFSNDVAPEAVFAQQVMGYGREGDVLLAISTSGNAQNVRLAACVARARGLSVIGLTGASGGKLKSLADVCICVPETETFRVQELHLPVYHALCAQLEDLFF